MSKELQVLKKILGEGVVSFHAVFAKALGSVPAGLMLSQGYFWQEKAEYKKPVVIEGKEFFTKTAKQWYDATGITEEAQKTARERLKDSTIWKEARAGMPAQTYFRIDLETLVSVIHRYLETGIPVSVDYRSKKREFTRSSNGKFRQQGTVINGSYNKESNESLFESNESNIPAGKKSAGNKSPNDPDDQPKKIPWTKTIASLFDQVNEEESLALGLECTNFNWGAGAARQFKALKDTRKAMIPDIRAKLKHEPTEQEIESGFDYLFRYGFRYLAGIAESRGGTFQFTPAIILNNYNNILQYAKQNHNPTSKQDRANAKRDAAYEELFRMGLAMDV